MQNLIKHECINSLLPTDNLFELFQGQIILSGLVSVHILPNQLHLLFKYSDLLLLLCIRFLHQLHEFIELDPSFLVMMLFHQIEGVLVIQIKVSCQVNCLHYQTHLLLSLKLFNKDTILIMHLWELLLQNNSNLLMIHLLNLLQMHFDIISILVHLITGHLNP